MEKEYGELIRRLFILYYRRLCLYAECILPDPHLAEDAVQEVFRIACQKAEYLYDHVDHPFSWLLTVLKNVISNTLRSMAAEKAGMEEYQTLYRNRCSTYDELPPELLYGDLSATRDYQLIKDRLDGKTIEEMTETEGVSYSVLQRRISRARKKLLKQLSGND